MIIHKLRQLYVIFYFFLQPNIIGKMKLYISDLHFFHESLLNNLDNRPFSSVEDMNEYMVYKWNERVKSHDEVYVLGDLSFGNVEETTKLLNQLKGKLTLIMGNHDSFAKKTAFNSTRIREIKSYMEINDNNRRVILSHYPIMFYNGQFKQSTYMLYGHVHNSFDEVLINDFIKLASSKKRPAKGFDSETTTPFNMINCFCMFSNYTPLSLDEWIELDRNRRLNY